MRSMRPFLYGQSPFNVLSIVSLTQLKVNRPLPLSYYMCRTFYYRRIIVLFGDRSFVLMMQLYTVINRLIFNDSYTVALCIHI